MPQERRTHPVIRIVADDRERSSAVLAALASIEGVDLSIERLDVGDYAVGRNLLVERKTASDFAQSVRSGRLFRQARRLAGCSGRFRFVVLEGTTFDVRMAGLPPHALQGALLTVSLAFGLPVLRTRDPYETAHLLIVAGRQLHRRAHGPARSQPRARPVARTTQQMMLIAVRDVGLSRADRLLGHFGSIRALATASVEDLAAVPGIGPVIARRLYWALNAKTQ